MITYNVKLEFATPEEKLRVVKTLEAQRLAFNEASNLHYNPAHPFGSKLNSIKELHQKFYRAFRDANPEIPSQIVVRAINDVLSAYRSVKSNKHRISAAPVKENLSMRLDKRICTLKPTNVSLTAVGGKRIVASLVLFPVINSLFANHTFCDPLIFKRDDNIFLSVTFNTPILPVTSDKTIGVDLGIKRLAATSEGVIIKSREFNDKKRRLRFKKRRLQARNTRSAKRRLNTLRRKERNMSKNLAHHVANQILKTEASVIVLEDLDFSKAKKANVKKGAFGKRQNNKLSQISFSLLRTILDYKAQALGKRVVTVSPFNTSKDDFRGIKQGIRKGCRYYGNDGIMLDADLNAANNIVLRTHSKLPVTCNALDGSAIVRTPFGQAAVIRPIVRTGVLASPRIHSGVW